MPPAFPERWKGTMSADESFAVAGDGTRIWWRSAGRGSPAVVLCDGIGCAGWIWRRLFPDLAGRRRVIHWNYRGHGRTEPPRDPERASLLECVRDLYTVLDAAGEPSAVLVGHSMGVQVCLEAHRQAPARVRALVLMCGAPGRLLDTFHGSRTLAVAFPVVEQLVLAYPAAARWVARQVLPTEFAVQVANRSEVNPDLLHRRDLEHYLADAAEVDPGAFVRILGSAAAHDATDHLREIDVPTLVVAGERDTFTPRGLSTRMHAAIPGSELLFLPAGTHTGPLEHPELVTLRVEKFLAERVGAGAPGGEGP